MTMHAAIATGEDLMEEGEKWRRAGDHALAFLSFHDAISAFGADNPAGQAAAFQQAGVSARMLSRLEDAQHNLTQALRITGSNPLLNVLTATIHRDLGAVFATLYLVYRNRADGNGRATSINHRNEAREHYSMSAALLAETDGSAEVEAEALITAIYRAHFEWQVADESPREERIESKSTQRERLQAAFTRLSFLNDLQKSRRQEPFDDSVVNTMIRKVRIEPLWQRLSHRKELMMRTGSDTTSAKRRNHALVALIGGDRVYTWLELYKARQSR